SGNATLSVVPSGVLQSIALDPATIEGGATVNGTVTLSAATAQSATVSLFTSNNSLATLPASIVIPAGASEGTFSVATSKVAAATNATITAVYGGTKSATLSLTACSALGAVAQPALAPLTNSWIDDALPANATATGDGAFTTAQSASGTQSIALAHQWSVSGLSFSVAPADNLVFYALVDPCNPPRELLVTWNDGSTNYSASWGEDRIDATLAHERISSMPAAGVWVRLEVLAARLFSSTRTIQSLTVRTDGGAAWLDRIGTATCSLAPHVAAPTSFAAADAVWVDDATPAGVTTRNDTHNSAAWVWDATQSASGAASHLEPLAGNVHQHYYYGDPNPISIEPGDVLYTYVLIDPCNPPREIMLQWNDGSIWHRATWGEDLIGGDRYRVGALPKSGEWVRLEVPAAAVGLNERKVYGAAFTLYDGRAWFDRSGKFGRVNLALHQPARQSSDFDPIDAASLAVDGNVASARGSMSITAFGADQWWEVDLGETTPMIDSIEIRGRTDCCTNQTAEVTVFVSDSRIADDMTLEQARALGASVGIYRSPGEVGATYTITVGRTGRYVRLWRTNTMHLTLPEVMVWAPANAARVNLAAGRPVYAPPSQMFLAYYPEHAANGSATDAWNTTGGIYHSNSAGDAYWQVDLGKSQPISSIDIGARTDCCPEQTSGYYILASDQPFTSDLLAPYLADSGVSAWWVGSRLPVIDVPIDKSARYIRIQRVGSDALVLTECRVWSQQPNTTQLLTHPRGSK
ncbi:MAG TPA: discoidin domain-containing protein, partial [Thermoanaerobaculia bacterium]